MGASQHEQTPQGGRRPCCAGRHLDKVVDMPLMCNDRGLSRREKATETVHPQILWTFQMCNRDGDAWCKLCSWQPCAAFGSGGAMSRVGSETLQQGGFEAKSPFLHLKPPFDPFSLPVSPARTNPSWAGGGLQERRGGLSWGVGGGLGEEGRGRGSPPPKEWGPRSGARTVHPKGWGAKTKVV